MRRRKKNCLNEVIKFKHQRDFILISKFRNKIPFFFFVLATFAYGERARMQKEEWTRMRERKN